MRLQEAGSVISSRLLPCRSPKSLQQRQVVDPYLLEPGQVQLSDPVGRDAEDLAEDLVGNILPVAWLIHQLSKLEFDQVVHLLLRELLHLYLIVMIRINCRST